MTKYKILSVIYFIAVLSSPIANLINADVQILYRVPVLGLRWIDVVILLFVGNYFYALTLNPKVLQKNKLLISLCFIYLTFECFQLLRTWGDTDIGWQLSGFLCTLNFFILIDLLSFKIDKEKVIAFISFFVFWGTITVLITNIYLFYSFITGNIILQDLDIRVALEIKGAKETVSDVTLIPLIYLCNLYYLQKPGKLLSKAINLASLITIYLSLIITFHRGNLATIILLTLIYIIVFSKKPTQILNKILGLTVVLLLGYLSFGSLLKEKGYDPVEKIIEIVEFTMDVNNPDWDKGRSIPKEYALNVWSENVWIGVGYNDLYHFGLPEDMAAAHNFVIASLFHRGIIGTGIYLFILLVLFRNAKELWNKFNREKSVQNDLLRLLIIVPFFWLIPFWTQDTIWEKYSLSIQFMYLGIITNLYQQKQLYSAPKVIPIAN